MSATPARVVLATMGRRYLVYAPLSALLAAGVAFTMNLGASSGDVLYICAASALVGLTMCTVIFALQVAVSLIARSPQVRPPRGVLNPILFAVGAIGGFLLGGSLAELLFPGFSMTPSGTLGKFLVLVVIVAFGAYLLSFAYERMHEQLQESLERIQRQAFAEKELELARSIQVRLLPPSEIRGAGYAVAGRNEAAAYVAGDYFDIFKLSNDDLGLVVADVAGKGMGASLIMASAKAMLPFIAQDHPVAEALSALNERLCDDLGAREFVALCFARFSAADRRVEIGNAGLPDPYLLGVDGSVETLEVGGDRLPLGVRRGVQYSSRAWTLKPDDRLLIASDGLAEAPEPDGSPLGYERLVELLPRPQGTPAEFLAELFERLADVSSVPLQDDWTAILLHVIHGE